MADDDLTIKLHLDDADHAAVARRAVEAEKAIEAAADRAMKAHAAGSEKARDAQGRFLAGQAKVTRSIEESTEALGEAGGAVGKFGAQLGTMASGMLSAQALVGVFKSMVDQMEQVRAKATEIAKSVTDQRDALRAIAAVQGQTGGVSDAELRKHAAFRVATGTTIQEAQQYREQFYGSAESAKKKFGAEQYEAAATQGARLAVFNDVAMDPAARLAGRLMQLNTSGKATDITAEQAKIFKIANAGEGTLSQAIDQGLTGIGKSVDPSGKGQGLARNPAEHFAFIAAASKINPAAAATIVDQFDRAIRGFTKDRMGGEVQDESQSAFLKEVGITQADNRRTSLTKIAPFIERAEAQGIKPDYYLQTKGYRDQESRDALISMYRNQGFIGEQLKTADAPIDADALQAEQAAGFGTNKELARRVANAAEDQAKMAQGMPGENMEILRTRARTRMRGRGELDTGYSLGANTLERLSSWGLGGEQSRIDKEVAAMLGEQGKPVGGFKIPTALKFVAPGMGDILARQAEAVGGAVESLSGLSTTYANRATGGQLPPDVAPMTARQGETNNTLLGRLVGLMETIAGGGPAPAQPAPGAPAPEPAHLDLATP